MRGLICQKWQIGLFGVFGAYHYIVSAIMMSILVPYLYLSCSSPPARYSGPPFKGGALNPGPNWSGFVYLHADALVVPPGSYTFQCKKNYSICRFERRRQLAVPVSSQGSDLIPTFWKPPL